MRANESVPNLKAALDRMDRYPDLSYVQTSLRGGREQTTRLWWKLKEGVRWVRVDSENDNPILPLVTYIYDGASRFSIYPDFIIKEINPVSNPDSLSTYYFSTADADYLNSAAPEPTVFGGMACMRFSRNEAGIDFPDTWPLAMPEFGDRRYDYVEVSSGNWIGYELMDSSGNVKSALLVHKISKETISDSVFAVPVDRLPVKIVRSSDEMASAISGGMKGRIKQFIGVEPGRFQRILLPTILIISVILLLVTRHIAARSRQME